MNIRTVIGALLSSLHLHAAEVSMPLEAVLPANPFFISAEKVDQILETTGLGIDELLVRLIPIAQSFARPPISNYKVGVAALGKSGNVYLGVNLEFPGQPLNAAVHGEQFLVANARNRGETGIVKMAISAAPCGHCRQFLNEMDAEAQLEIIIPHRSPEKLSFFLPEAFGPKDLGLTENPWTRPAAAQPSSLAAKALEVAMASHAPYSQSKAGVAIQTADGNIYSGAYIENAAFNPSLPPVQAALIALVSDLHAYDEIVQVILVEQEDAKISQAASTQALLDRLAPQAQFHLEHFR